MSSSLTKCRRPLSLPRLTEADWSVSYHPTAGVGTAQVPGALLSIRDTTDERVAGLAPGAGADRVAAVHLDEGFSINMIKI